MQPASAQFAPSADEAQAAYCFGVMVVISAKLTGWSHKMRADADLLPGGFDAIERETE